jgi:hypothetical protein
MLQFLSDWLAADPSLETSLSGFVGHPTYGMSQLRADLDRSTFLEAATVGHCSSMAPGECGYRCYVPTPGRAAASVVHGGAGQRVAGLLRR